MWLHGLGANGHDFVPIVPQLNLPADLAIRFIFPHAKSIPVTINGGFMMPAWYDILEMAQPRVINAEQLLESAAAVASIIDEQIAKGIDSRRIVIAGFSQGGAIAYQSALSYPQPLAGLLALSTYIADSQLLICNEANKTIPVHLYHGQHDNVVEESMGQSALTTLKALGYKASYQVYPMDHEVCPAQINDISQQLQKLLHN